MEGHRPLDAAGGSAIRGQAIRAVALAFLLVVGASSSVSQNRPNPPQQSPNAPPDASHIKQLYSEQKWDEIVRAMQAPSPDHADLDYYYGSALAQRGRLDDARNAFLAGHRIAPKDARFSVELAGVAFKQNQRKQAILWLQRALQIDASDIYTNDFLATIYFLNGNLEAALKYWNRIGKPVIETVQPDHPLRIRPALLDRALAFSPASQLRLADYATSMKRLQGLEIFPSPRIQLAARLDGKFDAALNLEERNGFGNNLWEALLSTFSGVAYQTLYPAYDNIGGSAINITSLVRWDSEKRRLAAALSGPLHQNPKWRYRLGTDLRNENWDIRQSFTGPAPLLGALNLRREAGGVEIDSFNSGRWGWSAGVEFSHRDYRNIVPGSTLTPDLLLSGFQLKQTADANYLLLRIPEHRLLLNSAASWQVGRIWSQPAHAFAKYQGTLQLTWFPKLEGDDYEAQSKLRSGGTSGQPPFDELYMLGMERDNHLWMRAHVGTRDGRKGSAPLGRNYFLSNSEIDKNIYSNGLITLKLSPFLDSGKITDPGGTLGSPKWLWDTGVQAKVHILGVGMTFVYGKDLRTGNNAFYFTAGR
jgi:tetratricopeptide (TPR) repeat protein